MLASRLLLCVGLLLPPAAIRAQDPCGAREPPPGLLITAQWLKAHLRDPDLVVLQVESTRAPFDSGHVAGARFVATSDFTTTRGGVLFELPSLQQLDSLFESLGIGNRGRIVLYGGVLPVSRLFFTLDYVGQGDRVSVLDGGLSAWREAGGETSAAEAASPVRAALSLYAQPELLADAAWVNAHRDDSAVVLLDTRTREEFEGSRPEDGVARPGHIPGARNLNWTEAVVNGRFRPKPELQQLLASAGAAPGKELVVYCRVGSRAAALFFVGRLLGYQVRLYDGSMNDWAGKGMPVAR